MKVRYIVQESKKQPSLEWLNKIQSMTTPVLKHKLEEKEPFIIDGDCQYVATALMIDLMNANVSGDLRYVKGIDKYGNGGSGQRPPNWQHYWIELDGWVLDASNTFNSNVWEEKMIHIHHAPSYYRHMCMTVTSRKKRKQFLTYLDKFERR